MNFKLAEMGWAEGTELFPSRIIEKLDDSKWSHVYWKFTLLNGMRFIYESHLSGGVQITPYEHLEEAIIQGRVKTIEETPIECNPDGLWNECQKYHGDPYATLDIIRYYLWIKYWHRKGQIWNPVANGKFTCNEFVIICGKACVDAMKELDYSYTPEGLYRFFMGHPSKLKPVKIGVPREPVLTNKLDANKPAPAIA